MYKRQADGTKVELVCNIGKPEDAKKAVECDGEGIGLFRTEFLLSLIHICPLLFIE